MCVGKEPHTHPHNSGESSAKEQVRNEATAFKRVINGKQFFKVQDDQRRVEALAPFMSAAAI